MFSSSSMFLIFLKNSQQHSPHLSSESIIFFIPFHSESTRLFPFISLTIFFKEINIKNEINDVFFLCFWRVFTQDRCMEKQIKQIENHVFSSKSVMFFIEKPWFAIALTVFPWFSNKKNLIECMKKTRKPIEKQELSNEK